MTVTLDDINQDYQRFAKDYDKRWRTFLARAHGYILDQWPYDQSDKKTANLRIFDAGCGTGHLLQRLSLENKAQYFHGLDGCPNMLQIARKKLPNANLIQGNIETIDLTDQHNKYDVVLSINILHHLNHPEDHLNRIASLCREGGYVFICDFSLSSLPMRIGEVFWQRFHLAHNKSFTPHALCQIIKDHERMIICDHKILKATRFWRLQTYKIQISS